MSENIKFDRVSRNDIGYDIRIDVRPAEDREKLTRIFVSTTDSVELDFAGTNGHLEYTSRGEDVEMDKAWDKYNGDLIAGMRDILLEIFEVDRSDLKFSRTAGCTCGCSQGFIAKRGSLRVGQEVFIDISRA
jgi:hypothetical protein